MKTQKTRLEEVEETASPERLIIVLSTIDHPELLDPAVMEKKEAEYESKHPDKEIVFLVLKREEMNLKNIDIDEELDF